jgi:acyl carrier protein
VLEQKVKEILGNQLGIDADKITLDNHIIDDLGADSLDIVEVVVDIETAFGIKIEDQEYQEADTVQKIIDLVNNKIENK